jgi:hypothetical protein
VRYEITELDVFSLGKVVAAIYAAAGLISWLFVPLFALMPTGGRGDEMFAKGIMMFFFLAAPLMYAIFGFIFGVVAALVYNLLARTAGGLRFTLRQES